MRRRLLVVLGIICLIGSTLAVLSTVQHFRLSSSGFEQESFCVISDTVNCDLITGSTYSEFLGVPISWWGTIYYSLLAIMSLFAALSRKERRATVTIAWFMALAGIPYCLVLAYIAFFVIGAVCLECIGMYLVTFAAAIGLFLALRIPIERIFWFIKNYILSVLGKRNELGFKPALWTHAIIIGLCFGAGWFAITEIQNRQFPGRRSQVSAEDQIRAHYIQSIHPIAPQPFWAVWGNPEAKVKIVEFSEFQCPFCRLSCFMVKPFLHEFRKDIAYYFVNYPLDSECNPDVPNKMHPIACYLSTAGLCANKRGEFWKYHDELFRNQKKLSKEFALEVAERDFGWNRDEFQRCIGSPEIDAQLAQEIEAGRKIYIRGTPALFLDGRKIRNWRDKKFLQTLVREEIKRTSKD